MQELNKNSTGLVFGCLLALSHLCWLILVLLGWAKPFLDWVLSLHMVSLSYDIDPFSVVNAISLLILTFVVGYVAGWVLAALWNWLKK